MHWFLKLSLSLALCCCVWVVVTQALPRVLPEQWINNQDLWGIILQNQVWSGTINVKGDLITSPGVIVRILPGTKVIIARSGDRFNFDFLPWHLQSGLNTGKEYMGVRNGELFWDEGQKIHLWFSKLLALGTKEQPIIISSDSKKEDTSPYDINSIKVNSGILSFVNISNYRRLEAGNGLVIRNSRLENVAECSICIEGGSPTVINNVFSSALREYLWIDGGSPRITDNLFNSSSGEGIRVDPQGVGAPTISHNSFEMPAKVVIDFLTGDEEVGGVVSFNKFIGGSKIKIPCDSKVKISENLLLSLIVFPIGSCAHTISFGPNFWGTDDLKAVLAERFINKDPSLVILIPSILKEPPKDIGVRR